MKTWKFVTVIFIIAVFSGCTSSSSGAEIEVSSQEDIVEEVASTPEPTPAQTEPPIPEIEKIEIDDPFLDKNGDGFQDVILRKYDSRYDLNFDGKFDYIMGMKFRDFNTGAQREYIESGFDAAVYEKISIAGIDNLCQEGEIENAWYIENYPDYSFWQHGYNSLDILADTAENDIKIRNVKNTPVYEYRIKFNPDGSIATIKKGDQEIIIATWDEESNTLEGEAVTIPTEIETMDDLDGIVSKLEELLASG